MSTNKKILSEAVFSFPVDTEDPLNPVIGQTYLNSITGILRVYGNTQFGDVRWGGIGLAWDPPTENKEE